MVVFSIRLSAACSGVSATTRWTYTPGVWTSFGDLLREPWGRVHWAGTETAAVWNGYMDGAVRSGKRAAREVMDEL